ncbi:hypothetical protein [Bathymodiolus platifrons methanotrophic gill symbiont]|uniref:hypothetical protein n=1 Tax=Bathymodiolus platifrons methanotrophic gill symbiont TaxID=113268 RepID=UPI00142D9D8B|nr:hypothetical protein [Bathymodiolus platifrons methanotrophic gill symbiont]
MNRLEDSGVLVSVCSVKLSFCRGGGRVISPSSAITIDIGRLCLEKECTKSREFF